MPPGDPLPPLARHLKALVEDGHWVLISTCRTGGPELLRGLEALGVDGSKLLVIDSGTPKGPQQTPDARIHYMPGPALLELLTLRSEKMVWNRRKEKTHILIHDMNAFAKHSPPEAMEQMTRYIMSRVKPYTTVDFCLATDEPLPARLEAGLRDFCEQTLRLPVETTLLDNAAPA